MQNLVDNFIAFWKNSVDMPLIRKKLKKIFKCYVKEILLGSITLKEKCIFIYCLGRYMNKKDESEVVNEGEKNKLYE